MEKGYSPGNVEEQWLRKWDLNDFFKADANSSKPPFCVVIPPPNVTGRLHMGHALVNTLQDILVRWKRMSGFETLWVPGTDHAGIATQTVVERHLMKTEGKRRVDYPREEFLEHVWKWKEEHEGDILSQLKRLGCSCDWSRLCFTMDETRSKSVRAAFKKLYDQGLIYKGDYLVNWDPVTQTALADDEVEYEEKDSFMWHFTYPLEEGGGHIEIATTRPETMLGDVAVAVNPKDERYAKFIGKNVVLPLQGRVIPIIEDNYVDPEFGTGAVKITPAHDPNDYEIGLRHDLEMINIMTPDGRINEKGDAFEGLTMAQAREAVTSKMDALGHLVKSTPHLLRVGVSYRSKAVIQPYLSKQWFVRCSEFKARMRSAVEEGRVKLIPKNWESTYFHWIDNLRDWCISRQLWWGHRIPIWTRKDNPDVRICFEGEGVPTEVASDPDGWEQDPDVLDTWFSSALWPFSALGWPDNTAEMEKFYPNSVLITGHDILFFWVARMILMGEHLLEKAPFPETFLHGLIYGKSYWRHVNNSIEYITGTEKKRYDLGEKPPHDVHSKWEKMSKSKGNIIDPIEMIDEYGADAVRMALAASASHARQIDLDQRRFEEYKHFANKVWNGARFVFMNIESLAAEEMDKGIDHKNLKLEDRWILSLFNRRLKEVHSHLSSYAFDHATSAAYTFFWREFCAYYVELCKPVLFGKQGEEKEATNKRKILACLLNASVRLLHPMAPYITEELFGLIKEKFAGITSGNDLYSADFAKSVQSEVCALSTYPTVIDESAIDDEIEKVFSTMDEVVHAVRNIRAEMGIAPSVITDIYVSGENVSMVEEQISILTALVRVNNVHFNFDGAIPQGSTAIAAGVKIHIPLPVELKEKERTRLLKEKEKFIAGINHANTQLGNEAFVSKAPEALVDKIRAQLDTYEVGLKEVTTKLEQMK